MALDRPRRETTPIPGTEKVQYQIRTRIDHLSLNLACLGQQVDSVDKQLKWVLRLQVVALLSVLGMVLLRAC